MELDTQCKFIYARLLEGESFTNLHALNTYGIGRLASRICDLVNVHNVPISKVREPNSNGKGYHTRYFMSKENRERLKNTTL